ncbi:cupin domain-containing protein [Vibrio sp. CAU 1672]|uniref:cupin domain-containing protein n=1 Tax=Vibrio sp. CAU 1672 TaxID=3032594 RepID=UPI0023DAFBEB|nr:cupin domain-containing protein [Vibrio sp. CAU 1672]MDF2152936.1 cupin domain-containing protein [Vibrio sp. CAU 1672]
MLNMDFSRHVVIETAQQDWVASPAQGVWRKPLELEAKEHGHTTSIVKYEPDSRFAPHSHPLGEEILVLDGVFSDEEGDYPAGTYLRNPPGSLHAPFSQPGCVILVKLNQFSAEDDAKIRINTRHEVWSAGSGGSQVMPLDSFRGEHVALVKWSKGERFQPDWHSKGVEIFVLSGTFKDLWGSYPAHTWLRRPHMGEHFPFVEEDTVIWLKTGHLPHEGD